MVKRIKKPSTPSNYATYEVDHHTNLSQQTEDDGSFEIQAEWQPVNVSGSTITTGNTVLQNNLYGIYSPGPNNSAFQSYVAENLPVVI